MFIYFCQWPYNYTKYSRNFNLLVSGPSSERLSQALSQSLQDNQIVFFKRSLMKRVLGFIKNDLKESRVNPEILIINFRIDSWLIINRNR